MKKIIYIALLFFCPLMVFGQNIERLEAVSLTKKETVEFGRSLLINALAADDSKAVDDYFVYLDALSTPDSVVFSFKEKLLLSVYLNRYDEAIAAIQHEDAAQRDAKPSAKSVKSFANDNLLFKQLTKTLLNTKEHKADEIRQAAISDEARFLLFITLEKIYVAYDVEIESPYAEIMEELNAHCESFFAAYPNSTFTRFIHQNIYNEETEQVWGFGVHMLNGYCFFLDGFENKMENSFTADVGVSLYYRRWLLSLHYSMIPTALLEDMPLAQGVVLNKGSNISITKYEFNFGYRLFDNKRFSFSPIVGIGSMKLTPNGTDIERYPYLAGQNLRSFSFDVGMQADFFFRDNKNALRLPAKVLVNYAIPTRARELSSVFSITFGVELLYRPRTVKLNAINR